MGLTTEPMKHETESILRQWTNDGLVDVRLPVSGTINDVRIVTTDHRRYVLRIYRHQEQERLEREHAVVRWVYERGIPAVQPIPLPNGQTFLSQEGRLVTLLPFIEGRQVARSELSRGEIAEMGRFLGRLHGLLAECPIGSIPALRIDLDREKTMAEIDQLLVQIQSIDQKTETDYYSLTRLQSRREWLERRSSDGHVITDTEDAHPLHGDYQETNVFFKGDRICGVIDWDKIYVAPPAWEVIRTLDLMLRFASVGCQTFIDGYRSEHRLTMEELDEAATMYGLMRAYDLWLPKEIYELGNDRVRQFVKSGHFIPIEERWRRLRDNLNL